MWFLRKYRTRRGQLTKHNSSQCGQNILQATLIKSGAYKLNISDKCMHNFHPNLSTYVSHYKVLNCTSYIYKLQCSVETGTMYAMQYFTKLGTFVWLVSKEWFIKSTLSIFSQQPLTAKHTYQGCHSYLLCSFLLIRHCKLLWYNNIQLVILSTYGCPSTEAGGTVNIPPTPQTKHQVINLATSLLKLSCQWVPETLHNTFPSSIVFISVTV